MISVKSFYYKTLSTDTELVALIGSTDNIINAWPEIVSTFPLIIYQDEDQKDFEFRDNKPMGSTVRLRIDIFIKIDSGKTTDDFAIELARIFGDLFFTCGTNGEVFEPTEGVRHRVMRFSRGLFPSDVL